MWGTPSSGPPLKPPSPEKLARPYACVRRKRRTGNDSALTWCGSLIEPDQHVFEDADHALAHYADVPHERKGLRACAECVAAIRAAKKEEAR